MQGENKEKWLSLCAQAAVEQDPDRLMTLVEEISRLLDEKQQRVSQQQAKAS